MKKIAFSSRYGLDNAVIQGSKTMTRRIIQGDYEKIVAYHANGDWHYIADTQDGDSVELKPIYKVGEIVAVAMSYSELNKRGYLAPEWLDHTCESSAGYRNKMFVCADLMPFRIRITEIKLERLQDISDIDAIREGIFDANDFVNPGAYTYFGCTNIYKTPREAFADLIDRISGKGTWESNPWVFVYEFEFVKENHENRRYYKTRRKSRKGK